MTDRQDPNPNPSLTNYIQGLDIPKLIEIRQEIDAEVASRIAEQKAAMKRAAEELESYEALIAPAAAPAPRKKAGSRRGKAGTSKSNWVGTFFNPSNRDETFTTGQRRGAPPKWFGKLTKDPTKKPDDYRVSGS